MKSRDNYQSDLEYDCHEKAQANKDATLDWMKNA